MISSPRSQWRATNIASVVGGQNVLVSWLISPMAIRDNSTTFHEQVRARPLNASGALRSAGGSRRLFAAVLRSPPPCPADTEHTSPHPAQAAGGDDRLTRERRGNRRPRLEVPPGIPGSRGKGALA